MLKKTPRRLRTFSNLSTRAPSGCAANACNPSTQEIKAGGFGVQAQPLTYILSSKLSCATKRILPGHVISPFGRLRQENCYGFAAMLGLNIKYQASQGYTIH